MTRTKMINIYKGKSTARNTQNYKINTEPVGENTERTIMQLDPQCIVRNGYLTKSPPLEKIVRKVARWRMRWFVLYDTTPLCIQDPSIKKEVYLYYYRNFNSFEQGEFPKGKISLIDVNIQRHFGSLNGYPHVVDVETEHRVHHICATQKQLIDDWLVDLQQHSIMDTSKSSKKRSCLLKKGRRGSSIFHSHIDISKKEKKRKNRKSKDNTNSECYLPTTIPKVNPFASAGKFFEDPIRQACTLDKRTSNSLSSSYCSSDDGGSPAIIFRQEIKVKKTASTLPTQLLDLEESDRSDDENVRTSSGSSSTSTNTQIRITSLSYFPQSQDDFFGDFGGPKLSAGSKNKTSRDLLTNQMKCRSTSDLTFTQNQDCNALFVPVRTEDVNNNTEPMDIHRSGHYRPKRPSSAFICFQTNF